jgi:hypothetical protein
MLNGVNRRTMCMYVYVYCLGFLRGQQYVLLIPRESSSSRIISDSIDTLYNCVVTQGFFFCMALEVKDSRDLPFSGF